MAKIYKWFQTTMDDLVKPFMENKKAVLILMALLLGTGAYTLLDLTSREHVAATPAPVPTPASGSVERTERHTTITCPVGVVHKSVVDEIEAACLAGRSAHVKKYHEQ